MVKSPDILPPQTRIACAMMFERRPTPGQLINTVRLMAAAIVEKALGTTGMPPYAAYAYWHEMTLECGISGEALPQVAKDVAGPAVTALRADAELLDSLGDAGDEQDSLRQEAYADANKLLTLMQDAQERLRMELLPLARAAIKERTGV